MIATAEERMALLNEVSTALYDGTESWQACTEEDFRETESERYANAVHGTDGLHCHNLGSDLAYLFAAIARGTVVQWDEPLADSEGDEYVDPVKLCRGLFPPEHPVWDHIEIVPNPDEEERDE